MKFPIQQKVCHIGKVMTSFIVVKIKAKEIPSGRWPYLNGFWSITHKNFYRSSISLQY